MMQSYSYRFKTENILYKTVMEESYMRKFTALILLISFLICGISINSLASSDLTDNSDEVSGEVTIDAPEINAKSALLMDAKTGTVLFSKNASEALPPASVTKVMTLLLVAEAIDRGEIKLSDNVIVSENASSMGGSQIFLKEGEKFTVEELLKSTIIASANDAAVALAELVAGNEAYFVAKMNERANQLGMNNTHFENATGLDDSVENHTTSAYDIGLMSKELLKYDIITKYTNVWQDSIRNGEFILTNTNRLVRFYDGCTGLKTGSTDKAGFCISATAKRGEMHLIAVIMGAETRDARNNAARMLLDYGFANFSLYYEAETVLEEIPILYGVKNSVAVVSEEFAKVINKSDKKKIEKEYLIPEVLNAPLKEGDDVGEIVYKIGDDVIGKSKIIVCESIDRITFNQLFTRIIRAILIGK